MNDTKSKGFLALNTDRLDLSFIRLFYEEMRDKDDAYITAYFEDHGQEEDRFANFEALLRFFSNRDEPLPNDFDGSIYFAMHDDIASASTMGWQAAAHFLVYGRAEGRSYKMDSTTLEMSTSQASILDRSDRWSEHQNLSDGERKSIVDAFDTDYYLHNSVDLQGQSIDLLHHFLHYGWREHRDPSPQFNTSYYLKENPDIADGGINPFVHYILHGKSEGRNAISFDQKLELKKFDPLISVIVPNYNHARFIETRLDSIYCQTYQNIEVIVLDDASTDNSIEVIERYLIENDRSAILISSSTNSGSPFKQWRNGVAEANGSLIWICESDDYCEPDFLENCVKEFRDDSVSLAFGRIQYADHKGAIIDGLDAYRESAETGIWNNRTKRPAAEWFRGPFGMCNIIPNVGGCLFKKQSIDESIWNEAGTYKIVGDWYLYLYLAAGGQIAYNPSAVAYFRQHAKNTSVKGLLSPRYYEEHEKIAKALRERWGTPPAVIIKGFGRLYDTYLYAQAGKHVGPLIELFSSDRVLHVQRDSKHVLIGIKGFHLGGGEIFPIHLANTLVARNYIVSVIVLDVHDEVPALRQKLDKRVAVYEAQMIGEIGITKFIHNAGVDLIHTHYVGLEFFFFKESASLKARIPYVVTLHGSYEVTPIPDSLMLRMLRRISHWTYLAKNNLAHMEGIPISTDRQVFIPNGMPTPIANPSINRGSLGIPSDAIVITIASRAIWAKGWDIAVRATVLAQGQTKEKLYLLLLGDGPALNDIKIACAGHSNIVFIGFSDEVPSYLHLSDILILPTRFKGESYPLIVIQALQSSLPVIATDIGKIKEMVTKGTDTAGILVENTSDDLRMVDDTSRALLVLCDPGIRRKMSRLAGLLGQEYDIEKVASSYCGIYEQAMACHNEGIAGTHA